MINWQNIGAMFDALTSELGRGDAQIEITYSADNPANRVIELKWLVRVEERTWTVNESLPMLQVSASVSPAGIGKMVAESMKRKLQLAIDHASLTTS